MKRLLIILLVLIIGSLAAQVKIVTEDLPPYNYLENGKVVGVSTEIVETAFKRAGISYEISAYPWSRAYKMAQTDENTLIYSMGRNDEREKLFKWVAPIVPYNINVYKLASRKDLNVTKLEDLMKYKVGVVRDDFRMQFFEEKGFKKGEQLDVVDHDDVNVKKLFGKRIDFVPVNALSVKPLLDRNGQSVDKVESVLTIIQTDLWMAFSPNTSSDIVDKVTKAVESMKADGTYDKILKKYLK